MVQVIIHGLTKCLFVYKTKRLWCFWDKTAPSGPPWAPLIPIKCFDSREHLAGQDVVFPELSGADPVIMDFILLTQTNHTIYDYGSFGFSAAVTAGGSTMVADGYRFAHQIFYLFLLKTYLQQEAAPDPCSNQEKVTRGLDQGWCHIDTTATKRERERSEHKYTLDVHTCIHVYIHVFSVTDIYALIYSYLRW